MDRPYCDVERYVQSSKDPLNITYFLFMLVKVQESKGLPLLCYSCSAFVSFPKQVLCLKKADW